jgi:hypothetical protein
MAYLRCIERGKPYPEQKQGGRAVAVGHDDSLLHLEDTGYQVKVILSALPPAWRCVIGGIISYAYSPRPGIRQLI